jgi:small subunit ribosomal protein S8
MYNDPVADMLTRLRNASTAGHTIVEMPSSKMKEAIAKVLLDEGYIRLFEVLSQEHKKTLRVLLKYDKEGYPLIRKIARVSRPGLRKYFKVSNLPRIMLGAGVAIVSTPNGVLSDRNARKQSVGGELLCYVY